MAPDAGQFKIEEESFRVFPSSIPSRVRKAVYNVNEASWPKDGKAPYYVFSNVYSNFWLIFGKLWEARPRLYQRQFLQVNNRLKALDEIHKIYTYASFGEKNRTWKWTNENV